MAGTITSLPHTLDISSQAVINTLCQADTGSAKTYVAGGSWSGDHAVKLWLPTASQGYGCIRGVQFSGDASGQIQINIRFVMQLPQAYMEDDALSGGPGPKHIILLRVSETNRFIAQMHGFADTPQQWDMGLGNEITPQYPDPRVWDYSQHVSDAVCYEYEAVIGGQFRLWITKRTGSTWNETELYGAASDTPPSCPSGSTWSNIDVLGGFGGPGSEGASNAGAFMLLSDIVVSNAYIGPPVGFRGGVANPARLIIRKA